MTVKRMRSRRASHEPAVTATQSQREEAVEVKLRSAAVLVDDRRAGALVEEARSERYSVQYDAGYDGPPISLTMPVRAEPYYFNTFPPFFDGLLPEGVQLEALLRQRKIDRGDLFAQLLAVGGDLVGSVTVVTEPRE